jgi:murein L,D-transpeptidase YafK
MDDKYDLVIFRASQELKVMSGNQVVKLFHIAYGKGGQGAKRTLGDKKTPLGVYKIIKFKGNSKFHYFMQLDYPNLLDAWYGYKNKIISATEFKNIATAIKHNKIAPQDTKLGGYIGIHGLGNTTDQKLAIHSETNWTQGCIAITNEEINDLKKYVTIGTRVIINE